MILYSFPKYLPAFLIPFLLVFHSWVTFSVRPPQAVLLKNKNPPTLPLLLYSLSLLLLLIFCRALITQSILLIYIIYLLSLPPTPALEWKVRKGMDFCLFCCLPYPQCLNNASISPNIYQGTWMTFFMITSIDVCSTAEDTIRNTIKKKTQFLCY